MRLGITGHRSDKLPDKATGYEIPNPTYNYVYQEIEKKFKELNPEKIITGMALGTDQIAAIIAYRLGIPFIAAIPFEGQEIKWIPKSQEIYHKLLNKASETVIVSGGEFSAGKMQERNKWIVNYSDIMLGIFDGSPGGTANCLNYARSINREIIIIDPRLTPKT